MDGFVRADSTNLPKIEHIMIIEYLATNEKHNLGEIRGAKALLSSRDAYVDSAVGYVELRRTASECFLRCKVVPEHRITAKQYVVTATINEIDNQVITTNCDGCAAAAGGCKHTLVFLFWLSKRSSEPASTSVTCYWKKPNLSGIRSDPIRSEDIFPSKKIKLADKDPSVLQNFLSECKKRDIENSLITSFSDSKVSYNIFDLTIKLVNDTNNFSANFSLYKAAIDEEVKDAVNLIESQTRNQINCKLWHSVRQGRITASKLYECSQCNTDGALVQQILGGYKVPETNAIKRGKRLEPLVIKEAEKYLGKKIQNSGFILIDGLVGASPDGVTEDFIVEVKCPITTSTMKNYIENGELKLKVKAQMQAQMLAAKKNRGLLCIADSTFESSKLIHYYWVDFDKHFTENLLDRALKFWEKFIFHKIIASANCER